MWPLGKLRMFWHVVRFPLLSSIFLYFNVYYFLWTTNTASTIKHKRAIHSWPGCICFLLLSFCNLGEAWMCLALAKPRDALICPKKSYYRYQRISYVDRVSKSDQWLPKSVIVAKCQKSFDVVVKNFSLFFFFDSGMGNSYSLALWRWNCIELLANL